MGISILCGSSTFVFVFSSWKLWTGTGAGVVGVILLIGEVLDGLSRRLGLLLVFEVVSSVSEMKSGVSRTKAFLLVCCWDTKGASLVALAKRESKSKAVVVGRVGRVIGANVVLVVVAS